MSGLHPGVMYIPASMGEQCRGAEVEGVGCHPGVPREQMTAPVEVAWLAELDALPDTGVPDGPAALCWDCRRLYFFSPGLQGRALRCAVPHAPLALAHTQSASITTPEGHTAAYEYEEVQPRQYRPVMAVAQSAPTAWDPLLQEQEVLTPWRFDGIPVLPLPEGWRAEIAHRLPDEEHGAEWVGA